MLYSLHLYLKVVIIVYLQLPVFKTTLEYIMIITNIYKIKMTLDRAKLYKKGMLA